MLNNSLSILIEGNLSLSTLYYGGHSYNFGQREKKLRLYVMYRALLVYVSGSAPPFFNVAALLLL